MPLRVPQEQTQIRCQGEVSRPQVVKLVLVMRALEDRTQLQAGAGCLLAQMPHQECLAI
jgi:hypothetical protein